MNAWTRPFTTIPDARSLVRLWRGWKSFPYTTQLKKLIADAGLTVREAVRTGETEYKELGLADASDDTLLDAMVAHPRLIQRPFVVTAKGTRMARPTEAVDEIL